MFLSRGEILRMLDSGVLRIEPLDRGLVRENGVDLRIGGEWCQVAAGTEPLDLSSRPSVEERYVCGRGERLELLPNNRYLLHTLEYIEMPPGLIGLVNLRSTYARLGFLMPPTVVDAGFRGQLTIEVMAPPYPVVLPAGTPVVHLVLARTGGAAFYEGRYQGQRGVTLPRL